jgi:hypothetical protein
MDWKQKKIFLFDSTKTYKLLIRVTGTDLTYTAKNLQENGDFFSFTDKFNQTHIYPLRSLIRATELKVFD